jgi:hypothetical protein
VTYYDTFVRSSKTPKEKWKSGLQAFVDKEFVNASTHQTDVEEEIKFGTLEFKIIDCRINSLVDAKTGQRVNDDYKKIIFPDLDYKPPIGTRYRFDDNIWIVFSTDNIRTDTADVYIRRCNNTINTQDKYGNIHREPCYIDYRVTENQLFREYSVDVASGRIWVQCQKNKHTETININDRFIFGDDVFKVRNRGKYDRRYTFDDDSNNIVAFYADYDNKAEYDNLELGVADYINVVYRIDTIKDISNIVGYTDKISYTIYLDDEAVNEPVTWHSTNSEIVSINKNTGEFVFQNIGECDIIVTMVNRPDVTQSVYISVVSTIVDSYKDIIDPPINYIRLNATMEYSVYEYNNGIRTNTEFNIFCNGLPTNYYLFKSDGNEFSITNLKKSSEPLMVYCVNKRTNNAVIAIIELGGV